MGSTPTKAAGGGLITIINIKMLFVFFILYCIVYSISYAWYLRLRFMYVPKGERIRTDSGSGCYAQKRKLHSHSHTQTQHTDTARIRIRSPQPQLQLKSTHPDPILII
jgi:hypothetical protein